MSTITMSEARALYTRGNNAGRGYAPYADVAGDDTIDEAVVAAQADGWELVLPRETDYDVAVLRNGDGEVMGIGGDAMGAGAWAVMLSDERRSLTVKALTETQIRALRVEAYEAGDMMLGATCDLALAGEIDPDDYTVLTPRESRELRAMTVDDAHQVIAAAIDSARQS